MLSIKRVLLALGAFSLSLCASLAMALTTVDVNKASAAELDAVHGIGPGTSAKILAERKKGDFKDWNDLITRVKGVGDNNSQKFAAGGLTVNGVGMAGVAVKPMSTKEEKAQAKADAKADKAEAKANKAEMKSDKAAAKAEMAKDKADMADAHADKVKAEVKVDAKADKAAQKQAKDETKAKAKAEKEAAKQAEKEAKAAEKEAKKKEKEAKKLEKEAAKKAAATN